MEENSELKGLLKQNLEISRESLKILRKLHRAKKIAMWLKILYWVVVILLILGAYYYVQPFVDNLTKALGEIKNDVSSISEAGKTIKNLPSSALEKVQNIF